MGPFVALVGLLCSVADYLRGELFAEEGGVHGKEVFVTSGLDDAFASVVDEDGALLGLFVGVAADVDEGFDDVVEGVVVVVVDNEAASAVLEDAEFFVKFGI